MEQGIRAQANLRVHTAPELWNVYQMGREKEEKKAIQKLRGSGGGGGGGGGRYGGRGRGG